MNRRIFLILFSLLFVTCDNVDVVISQPETDQAKGVLYSIDFSLGEDTSDISGINTCNRLSSDGLLICDPVTPIVLTRDYSIAERSFEMDCVFSENTIIHIANSYSGIDFILDINNKLLCANEAKYKIDFLEPNTEYIISISKDYQNQSFSIESLLNGKEWCMSFINDGEGGVGKGSINNTPNVYQMPHGFYTVVCHSGQTVCKKIIISTPKKKIKVLLFGDSITETEVYYPSLLFSQSWPQLLRREITECVTSGFSGKRVSDIFPIMKNELPYLDVEYVMLTIGTNGGNTIENLSEVIEYLLSLGVKPLLNHIPCNENNTQDEVNFIIDKVRQKYSIKGADFDKVTVSENGFVDKEKMFWEDYGPDYIELKHDYWHHPNVKGSAAMFEQVHQDIPELFN